MARSPKRSAAANGAATVDTAMYVVNFGESNGFAFIAANKNKEAVLAVTESGNFDDPDNIDNLGLKIAYEGAMAYASIVGPPIIPTPDEPVNPQYMEFVCDTVQYTIAPRLKVSFYTLDGGNYSCAQLASAMAMSCIKNPTSITLTYDNNRVLQLDWDLIIDSYGFNYTVPHQLLTELGHRMHHVIGKGTTFSDCNSVMKQILPNNVGSIINSSDINAQISRFKDSGVAIMAGTDKATNQGHIWVVDGYKYRYITETLYKITVLKGTNKEISREIMSHNVIEHSNLYHIDWCWDGQCNGYFHSILFSPTRPYSYDDTFATIAPGDYSFDYNVMHFLVY